MIGEPTSPRSVVALLSVDAALLAMMELFFLTLTVGSVPVVVSPVVALVSTPWLVRAAGAVGGPRAAAAPLLAWTLVIAVLGLYGPGGGALLVANWSSLALVLCGLLPGAFALGRVLRRAREARSRAVDTPHIAAPRTSGSSDPGGESGPTDGAGDGVVADPKPAPESTPRHG